MKSSEVLLAVAALATAMLAGPAAADPVFKSVMPNGRVIYGDEPARGASRVQRLEFPAPATSESSSAGASAPPAEVSDVDQRLRDRNRALARVDLEIRLAAREVERAQEELDRALEPLPAERNASAVGTPNSRLNDGYFYRVAMVQDRLDTAKRRLDRAYAQRNELRD